MNKLFHGDCLVELKNIQNESIDLILTSPPYDNLRTYNNSLNWNFNVFSLIAVELARVLKKQGVIVWVVGDSTISGSESCSSFKQAIFFKEQCNLNLHDTMIYAKNNVIPLTHNRYEQSFEYMFVFSKGKPKTFNPIEDKLNKHSGTTVHGTQYLKDNPKRISGHNKKKIKRFGRRHNIFFTTTQETKK